MDAEGDAARGAAGVQKAMQQGVQQGHAEMLKHPLELKFGAGVSETVLQRVMTADLETLQHWTERILIANTIDEMFSS